MSNKIPKVPTYGELQEKLKGLENENKVLGRRYEDLCKIIRKQGKDRVDSGDDFLFGYWS